MIPKECKRLAEVDFPIALVSKFSVAENNVRHGHPKNLHLWWARRPLAACRAMLLALLLPDPCDERCTEDFKARAKEVLHRQQGVQTETDTNLRTALLSFLGNYAAWENATKPAYFETARALIDAAHGTEAPLVIDTFAGGGAIPIEALRLGCDAHASDINLVAGLILQTVLKDLPQQTVSVADDLRKLGKTVADSAKSQLAEVYPIDSDGERPIAYIWARTITCDSCGAELPLIRSFWLCNKARRRRALRFVVKRHTNSPATVSFEVFEPRNDSEVSHGTVNRAKATCLACNISLPPERVRTQLKAQQGGSDVLFDEGGNRISGARLLCVVTLGQGAGRNYRLPSDADHHAVFLAFEKLRNSPIAPPNESLPPQGSLGFRVQPYGIVHWGSLYSARQKLALLTIARLVQESKKPVNGLVLARLLALCLGKTADLCNSGTRWKADAECPVGLFSSPKIPPIWDWAEAVVTEESSGSFFSAYERTAHAIQNSLSFQSKIGTTTLADAVSTGLPDDEASVWFTDPPYYNAIPYASLSDFFLVWLKRVLPSESTLKNPFDASNPLSPKKEEAIEDETQVLASGGCKDAAFFESKMAEAFAEGRRILRNDGIGCIVFAHKTTEGWEALLSGVVRGGWVISGSWPIATEMESRVRARDSAALATSVHLICRPRSGDAQVGDWAEVLGELPNKVGDWIEKLQSEGIRGADLVFACIGPAMEIYSRYRRVEDAEGRDIPLGGDPTAIEPHNRGFLAYVWETVGRLALEQVLGTAEAKARNGAAGALEEDSRLTALFLWTIQATDTASNGKETEADDAHDDNGDEDEDKPKKKKAGLSLIYDVARRFAQPLGIHLDKWEGRIIETEKGVVRLLPVGERSTQLFGEADASAMAHRIEQDVKASRNYTFAFMQDVAAPPEIKPRGRGKAKTAVAVVSETPATQTVTTLDRLHAAMLLQFSGQSNGLRAMLREEQQRGPDFLRLANALTALYPKDSEEKRLLDAMLLAVPRN